MEDEKAQIAAAALTAVAVLAAVAVVIVVSLLAVFALFEVIAVPAFVIALADEAVQIFASLRNAAEASNGARRSAANNFVLRWS